MSSGSLNLETSSRACFEWQADLRPADYVRARYELVVAVDPVAAAFAMAMEQSAATVHIEGHVQPSDVLDWTIRVCEVVDLGPAALPPDMPLYTLANEVYPQAAPGRRCEVELAVPRRLLGGSIVQTLNVLVGELPRLGFVGGFALRSVDPVSDFGAGPSFGVQGIRQRLGVPRGPLLVRSMRPAVGLSTATMAGLNRQVLLGGFHAVKDDELQVFADNAAFEQHVSAMVAARDHASAATGERKAYIASLICEAADVEWRWETALRAGVDAVLVAPHLQGISLLRQLASRARLPLLAHNTVGEVWTRHPSWGVDECVMAQWLRAAGADWLVTSGAFGDRLPPSAAEQRLLHAVAGPHPSWRPAMPILQGGKQPGELQRYRQACGNGDFMLIVASWVDRHPDGVAAGAAAFRQAVDSSASQDGTPD